MPRFDAGYGAADFVGARRPHEARRFLAVLEEDERRPELDAKRAPEALAPGIRDLDVPRAAMRRERLGDHRLRAAAMAAPRGTEFEQDGARRRVDLVATLGAVL